MYLVRTRLRLQFAEASRPWLELRSLMRVAADNPSLEMQGSPIVIDVKGKKERQVIQFRAFILEQEGVDSLDQSMARALDLLTKANEASAFPNTVQMRYDSMFIEPYALPFHELLSLLKDRYFRPSPVIDSSTDIGLVFDQHEESVMKHTQVGPMEATQLCSQFLIWPVEKLPEQFLFINVGYEDNRRTAFNVDEVRKFLESASRWQTDQVKMMLDYVFEEGG